MPIKMIPEIGHYALIVALLMACVQAVLPLAGAATRRPLWMAYARPMAAGQLAFLLIAYGCLTASYMLDDFSVVNVANNANSLLPWYYKFSAVWGNHEGSVLLWSLLLGASHRDTQLTGASSDAETARARQASHTPAPGCSSRARSRWRRHCAAMSEGGFPAPWGYCRIRG